MKRGVKGKMGQRLRIGFVGSGFVAHFHARAFVGVRDADVTAICSRNEKTAGKVAALCKELGVGEPKVYRDVREMVRDPRVDAVWFLAPNNVRGELIEAIAEEVKSGRASLKGLAVEKPFARTLKEAKRLLEVVTEARIPHGYLENQIYAPAVTRGKEILWRRGAAIAGEPFLARCAEEHSGPHRAWFWRGDLQGGGVLNDMLCHSVAAGRFFLTPLGERLTALRPLAVTAQIAALKWTRPRYAEKLKRMWEHEMEVDYTDRPAEDYASARFVFETPQGNKVLVEATTSWSFVGPGLRLSFEVLGPEYSLQINTLGGEGHLFFSRNVIGPEGEDLVEKQNAEQGLMPFIADEAHTYGYTAEDRHMVSCFLKGETPYTTLEDGLQVTELLMAAYRSAEEQKTLSLPTPDLETFVPAVAQGTWHP